MSSTLPTVHVGIAGWIIPKSHEQLFPGSGSHLERYAARFRCVEINTTFYRPHRVETYRKWAASVPADFRFAVKMPRWITHFKRLANTEADFLAFREQFRGLGKKLGPILVQLPPSLKFEAGLVDSFLRMVRKHFRGGVAIEPRHATWFTSEVEMLLRDRRVARVAADPIVCAGADQPGGWKELVYFRLHGSPKKYYSPYSTAYLTKLSRHLAEVTRAGSQAWCIFDNTGSGAAFDNALELMQLLSTDHRQ